VIALRVTRRPGATVPDETALALPPKGLVIGRSVECGLVLADPLRMVSRQHAMVVAVGEGGRVRCVSSHSLLWVNGVQVGPVRPGERARSTGHRIAAAAAAAGGGWSASCVAGRVGGRIRSRRDTACGDARGAVEQRGRVLADPAPFRADSEPRDVARGRAAAGRAAGAGPAAPAFPSAARACRRAAFGGTA
jgi:hypothetical protein